MKSSGSPRLHGIREHLERTRLLFKVAQEQDDAISRFRLMLTAIYSCRAIADLMLESAEKQEVKRFNSTDPKENRKALENEISEKLPFYNLIECIRIHDFHRFGILPPETGTARTFLGGPVKLVAQKGSAAISLTPERAKYAAAGESQVKTQRPLLSEGSSFLDESTSSYVPLEEILQTFLEEAPKVISEFEKALT